MNNNKDANQKEPQRIAQIIGKLAYGGVEAVAFNYYREIDKSRVQFDFYYHSDSTAEPPQDLIEMGARFIKIPPYKQLPKYLHQLNKEFKKNKYQIVHSHMNTLSVFPLFVAWRRRVPVRIAHNHSVPGGNELKRNALKLLLKQFSKTFPTHYFACSEKAGRWLFGDKAYEKSLVKIVNNAIDFNRFAKKEESENVLSKKYGTESDFVIGHVGRLTYAKNHKRLLEIFAELTKDIPNSKLVLVGGGELQTEIEKQSQTLGIEDKVVFVGQVSQPELYYSMFDVVCLPSFFEGLPLTSIEAQVAGVPVVASKAITKEAEISNGISFLSLDQKNEVWIEEIKKAKGKKVSLNEKSVYYDIKKQSEELCQWYCEHLR